MKHIDEKIVESGEWLVEEDVSLDSLVIKEGATITAPEGKDVYLVWFGTGREILPGEYRGDVKISVKDSFTLPTGGLCRTALPQNYHTGILINDGEVIEKNSVFATVKGGSVTGTEINDVTIRSTSPTFNGITIRGDSNVTINRARVYLDGDHGNDFVGYGSGIHCAGTSHVTINDSDLRSFGVIRNTLHVGEKSKVVVNNSKLIGYSPEDRGMNPTWEMGIRGSSRATMIVDFAELEYNNCYISGNGWGLISIDGGLKNAVVLKDCKMELLGARARGYGGYSIGDSIITLDHCDMDVQGYAMLVGANALIPGIIEAKAVFTNGSKIHSDQYGVKVYFTRAASVILDKGTVMDTDESSFVAMGCHADLDLDDVQLHPGNGVIMQLMDSSFTGLGMHPYIAHIGKEDTYIPGRNLTVADPDMDVIMNLSNMEVEGDFLNSSTNLDVTDPQDESTVEVYRYPEMDYGYAPLKFDMEHSNPVDGMKWLRVSDEFNPTNPEQLNDEAMHGPRNLDVNLKNAKVTGVMSSATAAFREGLTMIDVRNCEELNSVTQTPAETINNGVLVTMDATSVWTVTGDCYITSLIMEEGAVLNGKDGKSVKMTVDGKEVPVAAGTYTGKIKLELL